MTMGAQIPGIAEKPLAACDCRKFQLDVMGDHLCTCTVHSDTKKAHDWVVEQLTDLFRTTHKVKTQYVTKSRGRDCGDFELSAYLANLTGLTAFLQIQEFSFRNTTVDSSTSTVRLPLSN
jgi:hypothetical protein